jgi:ATP-binding cassette subfamily B protein/subfamily B ATP-binding cassette protein MsbA
VNAFGKRATYRRFYRYPVRQRRWVLTILALSATTAGLAALQPLPLKLLVDSALGTTRTPGWLSSLLGVVGLEPTTGALVGVAALAALLIAVVIALVNAGLDLAWEVAGQRMVYDLAGDLFQKLQRLSLPFHNRRPIGDSLTRLTVDSWSIYTATNAALVSPMVHTLTIITVGFAAWRLDQRMAALTLLLAPVLTITARYFGNRLQARQTARLEARSEVVGFVQQILPALPLIQAYSSQDRNLSHFRSLADSSITTAKKVALTQSLFGSIGGLINTVGRALIIFVGAVQVLEGRMTLGSLLAFIAYLVTLQGAAGGLLSVYGSVKEAQAGLDRVLEVLDVEEEVRDPEHPQRLPVLPVDGRGGIRFEEVTFGYEPGHPVLTNINLEARPGETIALVGPTGAGKSTLVSLIPRFYDPWKGSVSFDGVDLRELGVNDLRRHVALVRQDPLLLPITVADNIAYGRPGATPAEIEMAAVAANADEFIRRLPDGYHTVLGERGDSLSGGQRQRLAIARALLKDAPVLILDEPSSALDAETEHLLLKALDRLMAGRTTFVIAHRLSTIRRADMIIVLNEGYIVESGTHNQLLERKGLYHHLHDLQSVGGRR